jgi:imidazoleglycerol phosphate dehydratase HisB
VTKTEKPHRLSVLLPAQAHSLLVKLKAKLDIEKDEHHSVTDVVIKLIEDQAKANRLSV